jgi:hypothetical protein
MSYLGASGPNDYPSSDCAPDGQVEPGRSVVEAVGCGSARFLTLTHATGGVTPTYLVLTAVDGGSTMSLSSTDVMTMPELQNALAYFGPNVESVRVQTQSERRTAVREHVEALERDAPNDTFEFGGRRFELDVVLG